MSWPASEAIRHVVTTLRLTGTGPVSRLLNSSLRKTPRTSVPGDAHRHFHCRHLCYMNINVQMSHPWRLTNLSWNWSTQVIVGQVPTYHVRQHQSLRIDIWANSLCRTRSAATALTQTSCVQIMRNVAMPPTLVTLHTRTHARISVHGSQP